MQVLKNYMEIENERKSACGCEREAERDRETDRQTDRERVRDRQTERDRESYKETGRQTGRQSKRIEATRKNSMRYKKKKTNDSK